MKRAKHHSRPVYAESVPLRHSVHINSRFYLLEYCHDILKSPLSSELMLSFSLLWNIHSPLSILHKTDKVSLVDKYLATLTFACAEIFHFSLCNELTDGMFRKSVNGFCAFLYCQHFNCIGRLVLCLRSGNSVLVGELNQQLHNVVDDLVLFNSSHVNSSFYLVEF